MIVCNDAFFNRNVANYNFGEEDLEAIRVIDHARLLGNFKRESEYGIGTIDDLSTGCKTILNVLHNKDRVVNISECGENAFDFIFGVPDARLYAGFPMRVKICPGVTVIINDKYTINSELEYDRWWSDECERR